MNGAWAERAEVERESHRLSLRNKEATAQAQGCVFQSGEETPRVCARRYTAFCWRFPDCCQNRPYLERLKQRQANVSVCCYPDLLLSGQESRSNVQRPCAALVC